MSKPRASQQIRSQLCERRDGTARRERLNVGAVAFTGSILLALAGSAAARAQTEGPSLPSPSAEPSPASTEASEGPPAGADWIRGFYVNAGPGALVFNEGASVVAGGAAVPGASIRIRPDVTLISEVGYRLGHFGVAFTGGVPPKASVYGAGSIYFANKLGEIRYGPTTLTFKYHQDFGPAHPYLGVGPVFLIIFHDTDGALQNLAVHGNSGVVLQGGSEYQIGRKTGLFLDVKKVFLKTNATGEALGVPVRANIRLDPLVLTGGLSYHF